MSQSKNQKLNKNSTNNTSSEAKSNKEQRPNPDSTNTRSSSQNQPQQPKSFLRTLITRIIMGIFMIIFFAIVLSQNRIWVCAFTVGVQIAVFREIVSIRYQQAKEKKLWYFRTLNWYFLFITLVFNYGRGILAYFKRYIPEPIYTYAFHHFYWYCFILYCIGFVAFIISLRPKTVKYQLGQMAWTLMTLLVVVVQAAFVTTMIFEGLIWFVLPASLIVINDMFAYFVGVSIGKKFIKRPLTKLSPNKSWEGFIGAVFWTLLAGYFGAGILSKYQWFICPGTPMSTNYTCTPPPVFVTRIYTLPPQISSILHAIGLHWNTFSVAPIQLHSLVFALFASCIAPFGGFLASAIKRAYGAKDFENFIPGHGGVTDRMDCQFIMSLFVYVYYLTFIKTAPVDVDVVMSMILTMPLNEQKEVLTRLTQLLNEK